MKKITLSLLFGFISFLGFSQIGLVENFDSGFTLPAGWTSPGNLYAVSFNQNCDGRSIRAILDDTTLNAQITSPNVFGQSNGTDLTIAFDYKIVDWSEAVTATPEGWGEMLIQYSTDDGASWITIETINDTNHVTSNTCANWTNVVPAASLPDGSDFKLRIDTNRVAEAYFVYLDNISATQVVADAPSCVSLITPANGSIGVTINSDLEWSNATGIPTGYILSVGTSSGGVDVVNAENTGLSTTYDLPVLEYATTYYVNVTPFNASGEAIDCPEFTFTTGADPNAPVDCASGAPINTVYCYESLDTTFFSFTSSDGSPLFLQFNAGEIEIGDDGITIHDGTDATGPVLFTGDNGGDFSGLSVTANSGNIYFTIQSDGFTSCQSGMELWDFDVFCVDTTALPNCDAALNNPNNGDIDVNENTNINWLPASILVTGYEISVGSTPGGTDIANSIDVGNVTSWDPPVALDFLTTYYVTIRPYNDNGFAENCNEQIFTVREDPNAPVDCESGQPRNTVFCYENSDTTEFSFVSSSGDPLFVIFNSGSTENNYDDLIITDSDGSNIYTGYGNNGNLAGLSFTSSGDTITIGVNSDTSVIGCSGDPWDFSVFCVDPNATPNCDASITTPANGDIDVEIDTVINWTPASVLVDGYFLSIGTTPGGTDVVNNVDVGDVLTYDPGDLNYETTYYVSILPYNANGTPSNGCIEESFTTKNDPNQIVDCSTDEVVNTVFCYENNDNSEFSFTSNDGSQVVIVFNSGTTEDGWDALIVTDSDGTVLYNGYGNNGDLTGLVFVSSGDSITVAVDSDGIFIDCTNDPWDFDALCLDLTALPNCNSVLTAPENGEVDVELNTDINWSPASIFVTGYFVTIGSTPGGNDIADNVDVGDTTTYTPATLLDFETTYYVSIVPYNDNGPATEGCIEESFITKPDPNTTVICDQCPISRVYCYENSDSNVFSFTSQTGEPVIITFNSGQVENNFDELIVLDSDGVTNLNAATPYGNGGDISGLQYTSTGGSLSIQVQSDTSVSCSSGSQDPIEYTVKCQSYILQEATYTIVPDCESGQFNVAVDVTNLGSTGSVTVTDNQGNPSQEATTEGMLTFGPYPDGGVTQVIVSIAPTTNLTCTVDSDPLSFVCPLPVVECPIINAGDDISVTCANNELELSASFMAFGQDTSSYQINALDCPTPPASGGTPTSLTIDDAWTDPINLSFEFCYFGDVYDRVQIGANGLLRFEIDAADVGGGSNGWNLNEGEGLPNNVNATLAEGNIFGVCHDTNPDPAVVGGCGDINYTIAGTAPARQFIVNYSGMCHYGGQCNHLTSTTQIILYESSNTIDVNIFDKPACLEWNGGLAVTGIQNNAGDVAYVPPGRNTGVWEANNEFWRFSPSQGEPNYVFEWFDGTTSLGNEEVITVSPTETTTYTAAITYELCSGGTATITDDIVVEFLGDQADEAIFTMAATCDGGIATVSGTPDGIFTFNPLPMDGALIDPATGVVTEGVSGTTYTVEYTTTGACPDTSTVDVTVLDTDDATFTMLETCDGATVDSVTTAGGTFAFQDPTPTDGAVINATTGEVTGGTAGVTYSIEYTTSGVCPATSVQMVTVLAAEDASFTMTATCTGGTANITGDTGGVFTFDPMPTDSAAIDAATGEVTGTPGTTYTVAYTTSGVCPATSTETVTVLAAEDASFAMTASCTGGTANITGDTGGTFAFNPAPSDGAVIDPITGEVMGGATGATYSIEYTTSGACPMTSIESLTLLTDVFDFTITGDCNGALYELTIDPINNGYDANNVTYALYDDMNTLLQTNTIGDNIFVIDESLFTAPMSGSTYNYVVEVTDNSGCVETNEVLVESINCIITQGISPNNDGKNDSFDLTGYDVSKLEIFNRHGIKVYSKTNYTNEWEGQSDAGDELPVGTYFYVMEYLGNKTRTSWIYLNREN